MKVIFNKYKKLNPSNKSIAVSVIFQDEDQNPDGQGYWGREHGYRINITRTHEYHPDSVSFNKEEWIEIKNNIDKFILERESQCINKSQKQGNKS